MRARERIAASHPFQLVLGLTIWAIWFVAVYGGVSLACALAPPSGQSPWTWVNAGVGILTVATVAILLCGARSCWRARDASHQPVEARRFVAMVAAGLYIVAALATVAVALPALRLPPCV